MDLINFRRIGKMYHRFCQYIAAIRSGEKAIMFGEGYVVLTMEYYEELKRRKSRISIFGCNDILPLVRSGVIVCSSLPSEIDTPVKPFLNFEIPEHCSPKIFRESNAKRCNYSTKVKRK